jgi:hypothetical protein
MNSKAGLISDKLTSKLLLVPVFLLMVFLSACQERGERVSGDIPGAGGDSASTQKKEVRDLLASLDMYAFDKPLKAPDFELTDLSGRKVGLNEYRGKVVLLSFWATW